MAKKKVVEEEEEEEEYEDDTMEEETFECRECKKTVETGEGDDHMALCDDCMEDYNVDKFWKDYDKGKITDDTLKTTDLTPYLTAKAKKKRAK